MLAHITLGEVAMVLGVFLAGGILGWAWARRPGKSDIGEER